MIDFAYNGSGPYCYSNSLAMMMGAEAPPVAVIETLTGSPFGMQMSGGTLPFFDPLGWDPETGVNDALAALGWTARTVSGGQPDTALDRLASALTEGPVMIGPVEMGHLRYQPGMTGPIGADHYLIALEIQDENILLHDPQGYPYATLSLTEFIKAWRADTVEYGEAFTMRTNFTRTTRTGIDEALAASVPRALGWLRAAPDRPTPPGSVGNGDAAMLLAKTLEADHDESLQGHLVHFAIRVGARRASDAATCLRRIGRPAAAALMSDQARLIGSLQRPLAAGDSTTAACVLHALAPTYEALKAELEHS